MMSSFLMMVSNRAFFPGDEVMEKLYFDTVRCMLSEGDIFVSGFSVEQLVSRKNYAIDSDDLTPFGMVVFKSYLFGRFVDKVAKSKTYEDMGPLKRSIAAKRRSS
jgi:hypothetical protein